MSMIAEFTPKQAVVIDKVDYMRKEIDVVITIEDETHDLDIVLLYEESDNNECLRSLYGYQVGNGDIQKPISGDPDISIDWGENIHNEITDWFFTTFIVQEDEKNEKIGDVIDEVFSKVWDVLEEENLV